MTTLSDVQIQADKLSPVEREKLIAHLISEAPSPDPMISDEEADRRDAEMDSGEVEPVSHEDFVKQARG